LVGKIRHSIRVKSVFGGFSGLARSLIIPLHEPADKSGGPKGRFQMSSTSQFTRTLIAIVAALAVSTVAVGAAVGPVPTHLNEKVSINA
jgi:hypothetical protein